MAQERFHNYKRPLNSLQENYRMVGMMAHGVYAGFDSFEIVSGSLLKMKHNLTGTTRLKLDGSGNDGPFGLFTTKQGSVIYDDTEVQVTVDFAVVNPRIDLLVVNHTYLDSVGGSPATYSIIKGAEAAVPVPPAVALPLSQVVIGRFLVYVGADHTQTKFVRSDTKKLGGNYAAFSKETEDDLGLAPEADFNKLQRTGIYHLENVPTNAPAVTTGNLWTLWVFKRASRLTQMAFNAENGKAYVRAALTFSAEHIALTWGAWINLNNPDVPAADLTPVFNAIGDRTYTQDNYVVDLQSLTASIDSLDIALKAVDIILDQAVIDIDNLEAAIGNRTYTEDNIVVDGETITASLDKLDKSFGKASSGNFNNFTQSGIYAISGSSMSNTPVTLLTFVGHLIVARVDANTIRQVLTQDSTGQQWTRTRVSGVWGSWFVSKLGSYFTTFGGWNMDTTATKVIPLPNIGQRIVSVKATVYDDTPGPLFNKYTLEHTSNGVKQWWVLNINSNSQITLSRLTGGTFDAAAFNNAFGEVFVEYADYV